MRSWLGAKAGARVGWTAATAVLVSLTLTACGSGGSSDPAADSSRTTLGTRNSIAQPDAPVMTTLGMTGNAASAGSTPSQWTD